MKEGSGTRLSPALAYCAERRLFLTEDAMIGAVFTCIPRYGLSSHLEEQLETLLEDDYPAGTQLQVLLHASPNLVRAFDDRRALMARSGDATDAALASRQIEWMAGGTDAGFDELDGLHLRRLRLVVSVKIPLEAATPQEEELERIEQVARRLGRNLAAIGVAPERIDATGFVTVCSELLNRSPEAAWRRYGYVPYNADQFLNEQLLDIGSEIRIDSDGIALEGGTRLVMLSPKTFKETVTFGVGSRLVTDLYSGVRGLKRPFFIAVNIDYRDPQTMRTNLGMKTAWATNAAYGPLVKWLPAIATRHRDLQLLQASMEEGHRPVKWSMTLGIYGADARDAEEAASDAINYWSENGVVAMRDRFIAAPLLVNSLPLGACRASANDVGRHRTMTTEHVAMFLPVYGAWRGTQTPTITPVSRDGQLMRFCLFDSPTNYNAVVAAMSGSGKSVLLQLLIQTYLASGARVWTVDIGASYKNLCERLGGEYIDFADREISLNPFPLIKDWEDERDILRGLIGAMAAETAPLTDYQRGKLSEHLNALWATHGPASSIDLLVEALRGDADTRVQDLGVQLHEFSSAGAYGRFFSGEASITFRNRFTVLELGALAGRPQLQRIVLLQLIFQIQTAMRDLRRDARKLLFIDEAWELLTDGEVGHFIASGYRRFRKHNGAMVIATQSLTDLYAREVGVAIAENSEHKLLLQQSGDVIDRVVEDRQLALSPSEIKLLKSVRSVKGRYSEVFFRTTERGAGVGRILLDPASRLLFSTTAEDVARLDALRAQGFSLDEAVDRLLAARATPLRMAAE